MLLYKIIDRWLNFKKFVWVAGQRDQVFIMSNM